MDWDCGMDYGLESGIWIEDFDWGWGLGLRNRIGWDWGLGLRNKIKWNWGLGDGVQRLELGIRIRDWD